MVIKGSAAIENKIEEVAEHLKTKIESEDGPGTFSYWLGFMRALQWVMNNDDLGNITEDSSD